MIDQTKYYNAIKNIDLCDEGIIKRALENAGLFSKLASFPLAALQFELTTHCNAMCKHCYNNSGINNSIPDAMTAAEWISFAKYLVAHGGVFEVLLSGGEPLLLGEALFDLMDILHDDGTCFLLQTNGMLLTQEVAKRLSKYRYHWIQISIDGVTARYHDEFRQVKGCWEKAVSAAYAVASNDIPFKIAHCVTPYNLQEIDQMCDFAYSIGASALTIGELCLSGRVAKNQDLLLSNEQRKILFNKIEENIHKYRGRMVIKSSNRIRDGLERQRKKPYTSALIRPNGDIRIDGMAPFVIGNVLTDDFAEVWTKKINLCWENSQVQKFISDFDEDDRNYNLINFENSDIYI